MPLDSTYQTYRAELWELNELNYARFEARLEQRLAELRADLLEALAELRVELRQEIGRVRMDSGTEFHQVSAMFHELRAEIQHMRRELLRWMFVYWATTLLALAGMMIGLRS